MQKTQVQSLGQEDPLELKWQPTLVFLPGKSHRQRSLASYSSWSCKNWTQFNDWTTRNKANCGIWFLISYTRSMGVIASESGGKLVFNLGNPYLVKLLVKAKWRFFLSRANTQKASLTQTFSWEVIWACTPSAKQCDKDHLLFEWMSHQFIFEQEKGSRKERNFIRHRIKRTYRCTTGRGCLERRKATRNFF